MMCLCGDSVLIALSLLHMIPSFCYKLDLNLEQNIRFMFLLVAIHPNIYLI